MRSKRLFRIALMALVFAMGATFAQARPPFPQDRTFFVVFMGLGDTPYHVEAACFEFSATEICSLDTCLEWELSEDESNTRRSMTFELAGEIDDEGLLIDIEGKGTAEDRGNRSAFTGTFRARALGVSLNAAMAGRETSPAKCRRLVEAFEATDEN